MLQQQGIDETIDALIHTALREDIGAGDVTSLATIEDHATIHSMIIAKQEGIVCGVNVAVRVLAICSASYGAVDCTVHIRDGEQVQRGAVIMTMQGSARTQLIAERTMLNFMGRMAGIATATHRFVQAVQGTHAKILDTRKTAPGLRLLDKYAVQCGGGTNHRIGLFDMILIKDNHIDAVGSITAAVQRAREAYPALDIEVECRTIDDVQETLTVHSRYVVQRIMLDNMSVEMMRTAVALVAQHIPLEASGNVSPDTVRAIAETGVEYISVGAITHSAPCFDFSMKYTE
jgi:nicotinate-nucleotide pyrophosphorylase (carboxylating)